MTEPTPNGSPGPGEHAEPLGVALARTAGIVLRRWRLFTAVLAFSLLLALGYWYMAGRHYVSESRFRPSGGDQKLAGLSGIAAQMGVEVPFGQDEESPEFYAELATSRELLAGLVGREYVFPRDIDTGRDTLRGNLVELYDVRGRSERRRLRKAVRDLEKDIAASVKRRAGLVTLRVEAPWPGLAEQLNRQLLEGINAFNLEKRQSQHRAERAFMEAQAADAQRELEQAEAELERFLAGNRRFDRSPQLAFDRDRLQRRVSLRQEVYNTLAESLEQARIEEVRNTPVITIVEAPEGFATRIQPLWKSLLLGLVPGILAAFGTVLFAEHLARVRAARPEEFVALPRFGRASRIRAGL